MGWQTHLWPGPFRAPWFGFPVHANGRVWRVKRPPSRHGWWWWIPERRHVTATSPAEPDYDWARGRPMVHGYTVDEMFFGSGRTAVPLYCAPGCDRFDSVTAVVVDQHLVYWQPWLVESASEAARRAFEDRTELTAPGVVPELRGAFNWAVLARDTAEQQARCQREEHDRRVAFQQAINRDTAVSRRILVRQDVAEAARRALQVSGAELLDIRRLDDTYVVRYRCRDRRLECVVNQNLRVVDAGVCLTDEATGEKYDHLLTLESLPGVVGEAIDRNVLVVFRHI